MEGIRPGGTGHRCVLHSKSVDGARATSFRLANSTRATCGGQAQRLAATPSIRMTSRSWCSGFPGHLVGVIEFAGPAAGRRSC